MKHLCALLCTTAAITLSSWAGEAEAPLKALLITGGCCHDYDNQKSIIPEGLSARSAIKIEWTVIHQGGKTTNTEIPFYNEPHWAEGYDVVVHNECFAGVSNPDFIEKILSPHRAGTPAVLVHCTMHCYRGGANEEEWFKFCGAHSKRHGPHHAFEVQIINQEHEAIQGLSNWTTPQGELYYIEKIFPGTVPLAQAKSNSTGEMNINIWAHEYGDQKTRVFATTIGHHNETMQDPHYLNMLTRGLLWAAGKDIPSNLIQ